MWWRLRLMACLLALGAADTWAMDCAGQTAQRLDLPIGTAELHVDIAADVPAGALLEVREAGQYLLVEAAMPQRAVQVPQRYGVTVLFVRPSLRLTIKRLRPGRAVGAVELKLHCDSTAAEHLWQWFAGASKLSARMAGGVGSLRDDFPDVLLTEVERDAIDARGRALAQHLHAQALLLAGRAADASVAFATAAQAWQAIGEPERASAARVGVAEDLNRGGRFDEVLALARAAPTAPDGSHYFGVRLENARCLALDYLRRLDQAATCYAWTSARLDALDETLDLASTGIDFAAVEQARGNTDAAEKLLLSSLDLAHGALALTVQGRALFALAGLARDRGDIAQALQWLQQAQERFAAAAEPRWQANVLLRLAALLNELHAPGDARAAITQALTLLDARHAPARVAAAHLLLARIELADDRTESGLRAVAVALDAYRELDMPEERIRATLIQARLLLRTGRADAARAAIAEVVDGDGPLSSGEAAQRALIRAELALGDGNPALAHAALRGMAAHLSWRERLEYDRLLALIEFRSGDADRAQATLRARADELSTLARAAGNPLLAHVLHASIDDLRRSAVDLIGSAVADGSASRAQAIAHLLPWLREPEAGRTAAGPAAAFDSSLDAALGQMLLADAVRPDAGPAATSAMPGALLASLSQRGPRAHGTPAAQASLTMEALRALATPERPLLALAQGHNELLRLWLNGRGEMRLDRLPLPAVQDNIGRLRALLAHPDAPLRAIDEHAGALSALVLRDLGDGPVPTRLQVLDLRPASAIPWPLLVWPGDEQALVARTSVSLLHLAAPSRPVSASTGRIAMLVAAQGDTAGGALPTLTGAGIEAALIADASTGRTVTASTIADRARVLAQLAEPGAWLHLSAHGQTRSDRLAASGIWLNPPDAGEDPQFLGWADLLTHGVSADLVVLNACALAPGDASASAALDFAAAVSRAGAHHTIAAQWPVSDTASAVWVPAFYRALVAAGDHPDPAQALAEARRALHASRAFRHPFHWAGWVHWQRVAVPLAPTD